MRLLAKERQQKGSILPSVEQIKTTMTSQRELFQTCVLSLHSWKDLVLIYKHIRDDKFLCQSCQESSLFQDKY